MSGLRIILGFGKSRGCFSLSRLLAVYSQGARTLSSSDSHTRRFCFETAFIDVPRSQNAWGTHKDVALEDMLHEDMKEISSKVA